ncbi:hypothetical protein [Caldicellulosiruptor naganoensis]|uniref:Uncharacterized protein n=1 Tax=Caldicellulosiruptor naganoensis TaxID=29324 RepID=A0ABY7BFL3_9FIRM|nr:hypothetical protein [Caldicellulosiruptor naganoensis]WAM30510.1 hypothetical protein OTJ99_001260 [Caldicellulosiruptor naganoensis]
MTKLYVLSNSKQLKEIFKNSFVDAIKKKGKKILEIDLVKISGKKGHLLLLESQLKLLFDYIILYSDCYSFRLWK